MGLMDKVKAQATQLAQKTQEAAQEGKARLDQAQANRRGDTLLRDLGALVFAERTGRGTPDTQAKIDQLVSTISTHEQQNGLNLSPGTVPPSGSTGDQPGPESSAPSGQGTPTDSSSGEAGGSYQDTPGGFSGDQTFFTPSEGSGPGPDEPRG